MKKTILLMTALICTSVQLQAHADTLSDIKSSGKITVGIDPTFPPYEYTNDQGQITGYSVAIMQSFAKNLGVKLEFQKTAFSGILPGLISGAFDAEGSSLNITAERAKKVLFTVPYSKTVNGVLVRKSEAGKFSGKTLSPESLSGMRGAVKTASVPEQLLKSFNQQLAKEGKKAITIINVDSLDQTVSTLMTKRADFVFDDISVLAPVVKKYPEKVAQVGEVGPAQWMGWATRKDDTSLNKALSEHILAMQKDGELAKLQKTYLGTTFTVPASQFIPQE
ncbi:ABC transporter substrate-binding protein [Mangrovibacter sp. MFB070]|uniref:transporter substrate-binding domain-containing protein n=1 Tax=Mangrovibacter sp. MFB070 TaxID=1224318 RepID=UPI0004D8779C|nr:transporter substrate-binding domain-containing protein [Mangrovibacter sp. MFB070]KEA52068.1 ABC transporter substrate-binding protein [Mangrovibacter sp. MFB070]